MPETGRTVMPDKLEEIARSTQKSLLDRLGPMWRYAYQLRKITEESSELTRKARETREGL